MANTTGRPSGGPPRLHAQDLICPPAAAPALQYLIPVAKGLLDEPSEPVNYVFRIVLPILIFLLCAVATRVAPIKILDQMKYSTGFDGSPPENLAWGVMPPTATGPTKLAVNPLAQP